MNCICEGCTHATLCDIGHDTTFYVCGLTGWDIPKTIYECKAYRRKQESLLNVDDDSVCLDCRYFTDTQGCAGVKCMCDYDSEYTMPDEPRVSGCMQYRMKHTCDECTEHSKNHCTPIGPNQVCKFFKPMRKSNDI